MDPISEDNVEVAEFDSQESQLGNGARPSRSPQGLGIYELLLMVLTKVPGA